MNGVFDPVTGQPVGAFTVQELLDRGTDVGQVMYIVLGILPDNPAFTEMVWLEGVR